MEECTGMKELLASDAAAFMDRWDDFHDASIHAVDFDLAASSVSLTMQAQDKTAGWEWCEVRIVVEGLSEYTFRQPPQYQVRTVFEAGLMWDGLVVLLALDVPPLVRSHRRRLPSVRHLLWRRAHDL
jgi:hypothetical protein